MPRPSFFYLGHSRDFRVAGDRRRFAWLLRNNALPQSRSVYDSTHMVVTTHGDLALALECANQGKKLIVDYADHYLALGSNFKSLVRRWKNDLKHRRNIGVASHDNLLRECLHRADLIICSSEAQKKDLEKNALAATPLLDFLEGEFKAIGDTSTSQWDDSRELSCLWEGQAVNLRQLEPRVLKKFFGINIVSDQYMPLSQWWSQGISVSNFVRKTHPNANFYVWGKNGLLQARNNSNIGLVTLDLNDPFSAAKPANKLVAYGFLGLMPLATPTDAYVTILEDSNLQRCILPYNVWDSDFFEELAEPSYRNELASKFRNYCLEKHSDSRRLEQWMKAISVVL